MAVDTRKARTSKRFALLLAAGLVIVVPLSIIVGRRVRIPAEAQPASSSTMPVLTDSSLGPVRIGMTLSQLTAAIGPLSDTTKLNKDCDYVSASDSNRLPRGVSLMASSGRLVRIDIETDSVSTDRGARVSGSP